MQFVISIGILSPFPVLLFIFIFLSVSPVKLSVWGNITVYLQYLSLLGFVCLNMLIILPYFQSLAPTICSNLVSISIRPCANPCCPFLDIYLMMPCSIITSLSGAAPYRKLALLDIRSTNNGISLSSRSLFSSCTSFRLHFSCHLSLLKIPACSVIGE